MRTSILKQRSIVAVFGTLLCVGLSISAHAADDPGTNHWAGEVAAGFAFATGNSDSLLATLASKAERFWPQDEFKLGAVGAYGKSDGEVNNERIAGSAQYNHLFTERFYGGLRLDGIHDSVADVEYRIIVGPLAGYYFIKNDRTRFNGEVAPSFVYDRTVEKTGTNAAGDGIFERVDHGYFTIRFTERLEHKISETAKCWEQVDYLPPVDDFTGNFLIVANAGLEVAINTRLSLRTEAFWYFDNEPAPKKRSYDIKQVTSLVYKF